MDTLGLLETWNICSGVRLMDLMLKAADVSLLKATTICSGRYMIQLTGRRQDVATSINAGLNAEAKVAASFVVSNVCQQVLTALKQQIPMQPGSSLGLIESKKAVSCIAAADEAVKRADVTICRLTIANGINGKSYMVLGGAVASVEEAVQGVTTFLGKELVDSLVLANPDSSVVQALVPVTNVIV